MKTSVSLRPLLRTGAAVVLATAGATQQHAPVYPPGVLPWPQSMAQGAFRRVVLGSFTWDHATQVLVLREDDAANPPVNVPVLVFDPMGFSGAFHELPVTTSWTDVACFPSTGGKDRIVYTDTDGDSETSTDGLWIASYDDLDGGLEDEEQLGSGSWVGADHLVVVDIDADGDLDIAALDAIRRNVLTMENTGGGSFTGGPTFSFAVDVTAFAFGDFNRSSTSVELCVLLPNKIRFYDVDTQTLLKAWTASVGGGLLTAMRRQDGPDGDMAVIAADLGGQGEWELFAADAASLEPSIDLYLAPDTGSPTTWVEPTSLTAVDRDGDGYQELVVMRVLDFAAAYAFESDWDDVAETHFSGAHDLWDLDGDPGTSTPDDRAAPATLPLAAGEGPGAVFALDFANVLYVIPVIGGSTSSQVAMDYFTDAHFYPSAVSGGTVRVRVTLPDELGDFNHVHVVLWEQPDPWMGNQVSRFALASKVFPVSEAASPNLWYFDLEVDENDNEDVWTSKRHYYFVVRLVETSNSGSSGPATIVQSGQAFRVGATVRTSCSDTAYSSYLLSLSSWIEEEEVLRIGEGVCGYTGAPDTIGAYVTLGQLPGFQGSPPIQPYPTFSTMVGTWEEEE